MSNLKFVKVEKDEFVKALSNPAVAIAKTLEKRGVFTAHIFTAKNGNTLARKLVNNKTGNISFGLAA